jgi:hypothetical protein
MGPNRKGKFDNELPEGKIGEQGVQPGMQGPAGGMKDVCRGNNGEEINLLSLSFGSDTEYLAKTYVIVDSKVKQNGSLALGSLLRQGAIETVMLVLEEQFVEREVVFPVFARYFLARDNHLK